MEAVLTPYMKNGIELDAENNEIRVDLSQPRVIRVTGEKREGKTVDYFLKVTPSGKLCLV